MGPEGRLCSFYKRAQILVADLWGAIGRKGTKTKWGAANKVVQKAHLARSMKAGKTGAEGDGMAEALDAAMAEAAAAKAKERGTDLPNLLDFKDIGNLTTFPDYRVPQLLRELGIMNYSPALAAAVDGREEIVAGSRHELEIRAATVVAVGE